MTDDGDRKEEGKKEEGRKKAGRKKEEGRKRWFFVDPGTGRFLNGRTLRLITSMNE